jgi:hypothetical protein
MDPHKLQLKIFALPETAERVALDEFIPVFHRWIKERVLPELVVDVANYAHVPEGPGVVLIGHASDYFIDQGNGRMGLLHNRKRCAVPPDDRLGDLARRALHAAVLLEQETSLAGKVRFATNEFLFRINDRLAAPNSDATLARVKPELETLGRALFAHPFELTRIGGPKELFSVRLTSSAGAPLTALLEQAGGKPGPDQSLVT